MGFCVCIQVKYTTSILLSLHAILVINLKMISHLMYDQYSFQRKLNKYSLKNLKNQQYQYKVPTKQNSIITPYETLQRVSEKLNLPTMGKDIFLEWTTTGQWLHIALLSLNFVILKERNN